MLKIKALLVPYNQPQIDQPENAPDDFERESLVRFEKGDADKSTQVETINNSRCFRFMAPLYIEKSCLSCHAKQGYKIGDVRGGISITIPMDRTYSDIAASRKSMLTAGALTVSSLVIALFLMMRNLVLLPMKKLKTSINQFSRGTYSEEHILNTGDEFEDLCGAFSDMAGTLTEYQNSLKDKIAEATKDLEGTNKKLLEANKFLNEANVRKSDFIARASHELRTPLTSVKGAMDYISAKLSHSQPEKTEDPQKEDISVFFQVIKNNSDRLIRMVTTMLDIERIEMGVAEFQYSSVNLSYLIAEIMTYLQVNADEKGISIYASIPDRLPVCIDEDKIRQVIVNLLSNAIKFSSEAAEITISARIVHNFVVTEICDNGPGIPVEEQDRIFEKFYKFYRNGNKEGAGLGLAISKIIIEAHHGTIWVRSDGKNGSCFCFTVPYQDHDEADRCGRDDKQILAQHRLLQIAKSISAHDDGH